MHLLLPLVMLIMASSAARVTTPAPPAPDVISALESNGNFNILLTLINRAGLNNTLMSAPELTLFAPTDDAMARLPVKDLQRLETDLNLLKSTLTYHAVAKVVEINLRKFEDKMIPSMEIGLPIRLNSYGNLHVISAEGVNITMKNIRIKNGFIHALGGVMTRPEGSVVDVVDRSLNMGQMNLLLDTTGLSVFLENAMNITVFVPSDDAFAKVDKKVMDYLTTHPDDLREVLKYHVIPSMTLYSIGMRHTLSFPTADQHHDRIMTLEDGSNNIYVNDAKITERDVSALNGVIHVIDKVLMPSRTLIHIEDQGIATVG